MSLNVGNIIPSKQKNMYTVAKFKHLLAPMKTSIQNGSKKTPIPQARVVVYHKHNNIKSH